MIFVVNVFEIILFRSLDVRKEARCIDCASADDAMSDVIAKKGLVRKGIMQKITIYIKDELSLVT